MSKEKRRVVITGLGLVTPLGSEVDQVWKDMQVGRSGIKELTKVDRAGFDRTRAAEVEGYETQPESTDDSLKHHGHGVGYALAAARQAIEDAGLPQQFPDGNNLAVIVGTTMGNQDTAERVVDEFHLKEGDALDDEASRRLQFYRPSLMASVVGERHNAEGASMVFPVACAAGNYALGAAHSMIASGRTDQALVGGSDPYSRTCYTIFYRLGAASPNVPRPFDANREGMVVGEGAAFLMVEDLESAKARGARIYAEVTSYSLSCDAHHRTAPHPEGQGAIQAMRGAMDKAGLTPKDIDYVSAHGTGTPANDISEATAMATVFADGVKDTPISSIKSMIGHCMGAASAIENVICVKALNDGLLPPTTNLRELDPKFPRALDVVPGTARPKELRNVVNNAFAFGGCVSSVILSRYDGSQT